MPWQEVMGWDWQQLWEWGLAAERPGEGACSTGVLDSQATRYQTACSSCHGSAPQDAGGGRMQLKGSFR